MALNLASDRLPCGQQVDKLWERLADGTPGEHARSCEHCQAAITKIRPLLAATSELATEPVRPPADLSGRIMTAIRARARPAPRIVLPGQAGTRLNISEHAAALILRAAGDMIDGVRSRSCRIIPAVPDASRAASIKLSISLRYDMPVPAVARAVRVAVRAVARAQLGLTVDRIDIEVADVHLA
jgi:hypothetical protein